MVPGKFYGNMSSATGVPNSNFRVSEGSSEFPRMVRVLKRPKSLRLHGHFTQDMNTY